ncbi:MAG: hypothetical protein E6I58_12585 [Chloroflexi bacterium]|nr:MAG: hypothetical protein E6J05_08365 [Chloroflexota bacterium]TME54467.1 MAG: hypothetical protein E6I58_12585 [Chloroflexota bacterium]
MPSESVLIRLASIAVHAEELLAPDQPTGKVRVGLTKIKNDRRRTMEDLLVLLADPEVRGYLTEMERLGMLQPNG